MIQSEPDQPSCSLNSENDPMLTRRSVVMLISGAGGAAAWRRRAFSQTLTPQRAVSIAKDGFIFGYPMIASYGAMFASAIDKADPQFKAPFNEIHNDPKVCSPQDPSVPTPNCDTSASQLWADLRAEPLVIGLPAIPQGRYFSLQFVDLCTWNFAYLSARASGSNGGKFLLAGPSWKGVLPKGVVKHVQSETEFVLVIFRAQVIDAGDLVNVKKIQAQYTVQTLSNYLGKPASASAPPAFPPFDSEKAKSLEFFDYLAFLLQFCPLRAADEGIRERLTNIGVEPGVSFNPAAMWSEMREAIQIGMKQGLKAIETNLAEAKTPSDLFGSRHSTKNNYLNRASAAMFGLYGNSRNEVMEFSLYNDSEGQPLNGASAQYKIRFDKGQLPPVKAFWSLTLYDGKTKLPAANPIGRYVIVSQTLSRLSRAADGALAIYIQKDPPPKEWTANWLPAPDGPFYLSLRCYGPDASILDGKWSAPSPLAAA